MKILIVSSFLPYPLFSGGHIRLFNLMKNLKESGHEITLICEKREYQNKSDVGMLEKICKKVITVDRKKQWTFSNILRSGFSMKSFLTTGHTLTEMKTLISEELDKEKFDLIHLETFYIYNNIPKTDLPIVLAEHNIEYMVYRRYADKAPALIRPLLSIDIEKMKREERNLWKSVTKVVTVSEREKSLIKRPDVVVIANGVDLVKYGVERRVGSRKEKRILFIGDFKWIQNQDSALWIIGEVWPRLLKEAQTKNLKLTLWIVGKRIPPNLKQLGSDGIVFDEDAPAATELIYSKADALLAPIRVGGGTSFKILESMASGLPVLTTSLGNEGIGALDGKEILICETGEEYARKLVEILTDDQRYKEISQNSQEFIRNNYNWDTIAKKLEEVYKSAL